MRRYIHERRERERERKLKKKSLKTRIFRHFRKWESQESRKWQNKSLTFTFVALKINIISYLFLFIFLYIMFIDGRHNTEPMILFVKPTNTFSIHFFFLKKEHAFSILGVLKAMKLNQLVMTFEKQVNNYK